MTFIIVGCADIPQLSGDPMPMIDVTYPSGTIAPEAKAELLDELATKLLEAERAPDTEFFRSITWVYANEIDPSSLAVGGRSGGEPRFRVQVTVPDGALSDRRKGILIDSVNQAVLRATGLPEEESI